MKLTTRIAYNIFPSYVWVAVKKEMFINKCNRQIKSSANKAKLQAIKKLPVINIHLGCGTRITKDWVNTDIFSGAGIDLQLNFREPLPFETGSVEKIYSEHVLEHLFKEETLRLLAECFRVLKKGASIRIGVPDAEIFFRNYVSGNRGYFKELRHLGGAKEPLDTPIDVINQMFRMGGDHLFAWDFETMQQALLQAGFTNITRYESGKSSSPALCLDDPAHAFETLYVEGVKA